MTGRQAVKCLDFSTCVWEQGTVAEPEKTLTLKLEFANSQIDLIVKMTESNPALDKRIYLMDQSTQNFKQIYTEGCIVLFEEMKLSCMKQLIRISLPSLVNPQSLVLVKNQLNLNIFIDFLVKFVDDTDTQRIIMTGEIGRIILKTNLMIDYLRTISEILHFSQTYHFRQNTEYYMLIKTT